MRGRYYKRSVGDERQSEASLEAEIVREAETVDHPRREEFSQAWQQAQPLYEGVPRNIVRQKSSVRRLTSPRSMD